MRNPKSKCQTNLKEHILAGNAFFGKTRSMRPAPLFNTAVFNVAGRCALLGFTLCALVYAGPGQSQWLVITEILKDPQGLESAKPGGASHEFIEVANFGTDTFRFEGVLLTDGQEQDSLIPWDLPLPPCLGCIKTSTALGPGGVALILDKNYGDSGLPSNSYYSLPEGVLLLRTTDSELGGGSGLSGNEGVFIYQGTRSRVDKVLAWAADSGSDFILGGAIRHTAGSREGVSLVPLSVVYNPYLYGLCPLGLSPGYYEQIQNGYLFDWDIGINGPDSVFEAALTGIYVGGGTASGQYSIYSTQGQGDSLLTKGLWPADSGVLNLNIVLPLTETSYFLNFSTQDTTLSWRVPTTGLWVPQGAIIISEVAPRAPVGGTEWFELNNTSTITINLRQWAFGKPHSPMELTSADLMVPPGGFIIAARDTAAFKSLYPACPALLQPESWASLDNYRDTLWLWHSSGLFHEGVAWDYAWFAGWETQSLERVFANGQGDAKGSWAMAPQPSPGQPNHTVTWRAVPNANLKIGPVPFTPNGDGINDFLAIHLTLPAGRGAELSIIGFDGIEYKKYTPPPQEFYLWDGRMKDGTRAPTGPFYIAVRVTGKNGITYIRKKGILWR